MPLPIPQYIANADIDSQEVRYAWDEWADKDQIYQRGTDHDLQQRLALMSQRARIALANGVAEWLVYRFTSLVKNPLPFDAIEAAWAGVADRKYVLPLASFRDDDKEDWSGPVMGVIRRALLLVNDIIDLAWENGAILNLFTRLTNLTRYVLPKTDQFDAWLEAAIERVAQISPRAADDVVGEAVPREALDVQVAFDPRTTEGLIQRFLASLVPRKNPYLASPKTMLEWGFQGVPYAFDAEADRRLRRDRRDDRDDA